MLVPSALRAPVPVNQRVRYQRDVIENKCTHCGNRAFTLNQMHMDSGITSRRRQSCGELLKTEYLNNPLLPWLFLAHSGFGVSSSLAKIYGGALRVNWSWHLSSATLLIRKCSAPNLL